MIIYLCGSINGCTDKECKDWREYAKANLSSQTLDPMRRDYRGREKECVAEIVEGDKIDLDNSTHILVNYEKPSVGTSMEILYAWERGKIICIVVKEETNISPWLRYHSHKIFTNFLGAIDYLNGQKSQSHSCSDDMTNMNNPYSPYRQTQEIYNQDILGN